MATDRSNQLISNLHNKIAPSHDHLNFMIIVYDQFIYDNLVLYINQGYFLISKFQFAIEYSTMIIIQSYPFQRLGFMNSPLNRLIFQVLKRKNVDIFQIIVRFGEL